MLVRYLNNNTSLSNCVMNPELLYKFIENSATEAEMHQVVDWLEDDPAHQTELNHLDKVYCASLLHAPALAAAESARQPQEHEADVTIRRWGWQRVVRYAVEMAAVVAISIGMAYVMMEHRTDEWSKRMTTLEIPAGHYMSLILEDGTKVWLNAGTRLEYPQVFARGQRRVKVSGEAMFEVKHDAAHPFVVETFACDVEVLGTKFGVVADSQNHLFSTSLFRGSVKVTNRLTPCEYCMLRPNESVTLVGNHLNRHEIDDPEAYLWTEGLISLKGVGFEELMQKFERSFGVRIVIARNRIPAIEYNHGKIRISDGIDSALRLLQLSTAFSYTKSDDNSTITIQ